MTTEQKTIIKMAVENAYDFCGAPITMAMEETADYGYEWDEQAERYAFEVLMNIEGVQL